MTKQLINNYNKIKNNQKQLLYNLLLHFKSNINDKFTICDNLLEIISVSNNNNDNDDNLINIIKDKYSSSFNESLWKQTKINKHNTKIMDISITNNNLKDV